jgi:hypothetical protein
MLAPLLALRHPCVNLAAVSKGQRVNTRAAGVAIAVSKLDALARHLKATAAKVCHQFRAVAGTRYAV